MAGLQEQARWENEIYRIEENDPVQGGENGVTNRPIKQLANRTKYLKQELEKAASTTQVGRVQLEDSTSSTATDKAATPQSVKSAYDLANSKQSPATTLAGYGITDFVVKNLSQSDNLNDIRTAGLYHQDYWQYAQTANGYPEDSRKGCLIVYPVGSDCVQEYRIKAQSRIFRRHYESNRWSTWEEISAIPRATDSQLGLTQLSHRTDGTDRTKAASEYALGEVRRLANQANVAVDGIALTWDNVQSKPNASTTQVGIVQLSSATDSNDETKAATPKAVKDIKDLADGKVSKTGNEDISGRKGFRDRSYFKGNLEVADGESYHGRGSKASFGANDNDAWWEYRSRNTEKGTLRILSTGILTYNRHEVYHAGNTPTATTNRAGFVQLSSATDSTDENKAATSKAVQVAHDKGVTAQSAADNANNNANGRVSKSGDTMTGILGVNCSNAHLLGQRNGQNYWFVGLPNGTSQDVYLHSYQHDNSITLKSDRVEAKKTLYVGSSRVHDESTPYVNTTIANSDYGGANFRRRGNAGNWDSRIEPLPDKRWKFWVQDSHEIHLPAKSGTVLLSGDIAVLTGVIINGGTIPLPSGYTESQCKWIVTPHTIYDDVSVSDIKSFQVSAEGTRVVTCLVEGNVSRRSKANYIIIGVK